MLRWPSTVKLASAAAALVLRWLSMAMVILILTAALTPTLECTNKSCLLLFIFVNGLGSLAEQKGHTSCASFASWIGSFSQQLGYFNSRTLAAQTEIDLCGTWSWDFMSNRSIQLRLRPHTLRCPLACSHDPGISRATVQSS